MPGKPHINPTGDKASHSPSSMTITSSRPEATEANLAKLENELVALRARVAEQAKEITRLDELAETDPLTGIGNRRNFEREINRRLAQQKRDGHGFSLMIIDVDGFKGINDEFGHAAGDRLLQKIANIVVNTVRASDIVFRIGGDEFSILLPGSKLDSSKHVAQRLIEQSVSEIQKQMAGLPVGLSIGVVESCGNRELNSLIVAADQAMYRAKKQGGNRYKTEQDD